MVWRSFPKLEFPEHELWIFFAHTDFLQWLWRLYLSIILRRVCEDGMFSVKSVTFFENEASKSAESGGKIRRGETAVRPPKTSSFERRRRLISFSSQMPNLSLISQNKSSVEKHLLVLWEKLENVSALNRPPTFIAYRSMASSLSRIKRTLGSGYF